MAPPDDRERLIKLESEVSHLRDDLKETREMLARTNEKMALLYDILNQGKGARWVFLGAIALFGTGGVLALLQMLQALLRGPP